MDQASLVALAGGLAGTLTTVVLLLIRAFINGDAVAGKTHRDAMGQIAVLQTQVDRMTEAFKVVANELAEVKRSQKTLRDELRAARDEIRRLHGSPSAPGG